MIELDVSGCASLSNLDCFFNQLTTLNVSGCMWLRDLYCYNNQLTKLDVSGCIELTILSCSDNHLKEFDMSGCTELYNLYCQNNQLTSLDVSDCNELRYIVCYQNQINGTAMDAFVESLPTISKGTLRVIYSEDEQNVMTTVQVAAAKEKGWNVYESNGDSWVEYPGSEPVNPKGDLNGDGKIDIADAVSILNLMAEGSNDSAADLNGDGKVDIADFVSVLNLMAEQ